MLWYLDGAKFYVPQRIEYAEQIGNLHQEYYRSLKRQTVLAENLSRLSPAWIYYNLSAGLSGTDLRRHERFIQQADDYRQALLAYMQEQGAFSSISWFAPVESQRYAFTSRSRPNQTKPRFSQTSHRKVGMMSNRSI